MRTNNYVVSFSYKINGDRFYLSSVAIPGPNRAWTQASAMNIHIAENAYLAYSTLICLIHFE